MHNTDTANFAAIARELCGLDFHTAAVPMWLFDLCTLKFLMVNDAAVRTYGYSRNEFLKMTVIDIRPADDIPKLLRLTMYPRIHEARGEIWTHQTKTGGLIKREISTYLLAFASVPALLVVSQEFSAKQRTEGGR